MQFDDHALGDASLYNIIIIIYYFMLLRRIHHPRSYTEEMHKHSF